MHLIIRVIISFKLGWSVTAICLLPFIGSAQPGPLKIGDKCPDFLINNILNHSSSSIRLSDLKNKVVILDFWSTSCGGCITAMPQMEAMQKKFGDRILILPVTHQDRKTILKFWSTNKLTKNISLPLAVEDTTLVKYFPVVSLPYEIWINGDGIVSAITSTQYVKAKNIQAVLDKEKLDWVVKEKNDYDYSRHLLEATQASGLSSRPVYYSALTGHLRGEAGNALFEVDRTTGIVRGLEFNRTIPNLYRTALIYSSLKGKKSRMIFEIKDSSRLFYDKENYYKDAWDIQNTYCYESVMPSGTSKEEFYKNMILDLNRYLGLNGRIANRLVDVLLLVNTNNDSPIPASIQDTGQKNSYTTPAIIASNLNTTGLYPHILDETKAEIKIIIPSASWKGLDELRKAIKPFGLELVPAKRSIDMFVLSEY